MVDMLREAGLGGGGTETERYLRSRCCASCCCRRHDWTDDLAERLAGEVKHPSAAAEKDTMTHQIIKEMRD